MNAQTDIGLTGLILQCKSFVLNDAGIYLLEHGANVNLFFFETKMTALHWAAARGDRYSIKLLLKKGADKTMKIFEGKIAKDIALANGQHEAAKLL